MTVASDDEVIRYAQDDRLGVIAAPQRLIQVVEQVATSLDADRQAQQVRRAGRARPFDGGAMLDQAFDAAERRRALPQLDRAAERDRRRARRP